MAPRGRAHAEAVEERRELRAILGHRDRGQRVAEQRHARLLQRGREAERRLPAERDDDAERPLQLDDVEHALERHRLEIEAVAGVVVGRDRLRIRVHEHDLVPEPAERLRGAHAAVVELDPLADPVRAGAEHDDRARLRPVAVACLVREVVVGRLRLELARARVDGQAAGRPAPRPHVRLGHAEDPGDARVGKPEALGRGDVSARGELALGGADRLELGHEVGMEARDLGQRVARLDPLERLQQRLGERAAEPERLADRAHLGAEGAVGGGEAVEVEARRLDRDVVERRLERGARGARDVVRQLVERVADGEQRGELRDREARRLRRERRRARDARVHLDQRQLAGLRLVGELDVGAAGGDADRAGAGERGVAEALQLAVGQGLLGRDRPGVAGVDSDRVEVLDRADDDAVAGGVGHDLELELLPALQRALDEHLADRARGEAVRDPLAQLLGRAGEAAAAAAERERGADDSRDGAVVELVDRGDDHARRHRQPRGLHRRAEQRAVLGGANRVQVRADQLDLVLRQHAVLGQLDGEVQRRLPAQRGEVARPAARGR